MPNTYSLSKEQQSRYAGIVLLNWISGQKNGIPAALSKGDADFIKPILQDLYNQNLLNIVTGYFVVTEQGNQVLNNLRVRYTEYLDMFDIYCAVDLSAEADVNQDQFAFQRFYDDSLADLTAWKMYLALPRWQDLRLAVAEFKKTDPVEIVFMSFLKQGRFNTTKPGWEFELALGSVWNEMLQVCNTALCVNDLATTAPDGTVYPGTAIVEEIIKRGTAVMFELFKVRKDIETAQAAATEQAAQEPSATSTETVTETVVEEVVIEEPCTYYDPWWDPYYISPYWTVPLFVLAVML